MHIIWFSSNLPALRLVTEVDEAQDTEGGVEELDSADDEVVEAEDIMSWLDSSDDEIEWQQPDRTQAVLELMADMKESKEVVQCNNRVNLFIGPNASGKSTILRAIMRLHSLAREAWWLQSHVSEDDYEDGYEDEHGEDGETRSEFITRIEDGFYVHSSYGDSYHSDQDWQYWENPTFAIGTSDDWPRDAFGLWLQWWPGVRSNGLGEGDPTPPFLCIPATRVNLAGQHVFQQHILGQTIPDDGEIHELLERLFDTESGIFNGQEVEYAMNELHRFAVAQAGYVYPDGSPAPTAHQVRKLVDVGYSCAKRICSEVIYDDVTHPYIELKGSESSSPERVVHYNMGIGTSDDILGEPLYAGSLSSGTQGTLLWVWALALRIAYYYDWEEGWEKKPAMLLIDEIENHLHPTWQRRVIPALLEHFPGLQIFATTHSPFVVAGLKAGQVHLLKRDENGVVTATTNTEDVIGWTADEILRNLMGVDDPTDKDTAEAAREFRRLRKEGPRSEPEQEAERQERMEELRRFLSRELLAGGAEAAQRELFERQFAEALEKYRRSQELNQENG